MQFLDGNIFANNLPLWSLANEFWYYLMFPAIAGVFYFKTAAAKFASLFLAVFLCVFAEKISNYFLIWCLGLLPLLLPLPKSSGFGKANLIFASCLLMVAMNAMYFIYRTNHINNFNYQYLLDFSTAFSFSYWCYSVISFFNLISAKDVLVRISEKLSGFSYSIYVLHYPLLSFLYDAKRAILPDGKFYSMSFTAATFVVIIAYCYIISIFTEAKTGVIKKYIFLRLNRGFLATSNARS